MLPEVIAAYAAFALLSGLVFLRARPAVAILVVVLGGWLLLPVGSYSDRAGEPGFPWWISGTALPTDMPVTKAWVVPVVALAWALLVDARRLRGLRPALADLPVVGLCLWPLAVATAPPGAMASAYLLGVWGASWLLARVWFADPEGRVLLLQGLALAGLACLPIALAETMRPAWLYGLFYEPHPFRFDGVERRFGYRPIGFLEHGNLYALWVSLGALAAVWLALGEAGRAQRLAWVGLALAVAALAVAAQGRGALLLAGLGVVLLLLWRLGPGRSLLLAGLGLAVAVAALHFSGVLPVERWVRGTEFGQRLLGMLREAGIGSVPWRAAQDLRSLGLIEAPLVGSGMWDWWRPAGTRPWGLWQVLVGQYGLVGAGLALTALLGPALWQLNRLRRTSAFAAPAAAIPLALIAVMAVIDGFLNAWMFLPALLAAGSLARDGPAVARPPAR